ncbi:hypothetical protein RKE29_12805 [Streptomyces sp. B1866]|uniref:hypothetical protein n=1 Tax=Streptomyces sp. B1866 TaxID=3075431 RepID=UPI00288F3B07|nr:hypothetical protein [Streptomyces sp. B1866]MDT3397520.1 hypothetical protein [Streptomyces sp. B1866]
MAKATLLRRLVDQRGLTYPEFNRLYLSAANELHAKTGDSRFRGAEVAEMTYRRWTTGQVKTIRHPAPRVLERMFPAYTWRQLLAAPDEPIAEQHRLSESDLLMTARDAAAHAGAAASQAVPDISMDQLEEDVISLARSYVHTPPLEVCRQAKELLATAQDMLDRTRMPRQQQRAYLCAGQAAVLLASVAFDLGALSPSAQLARTAALYGQIIEHGPLQAFAYGALALRAYWEGRPAEAVRHIQQAQQFTGLGDTAVTRLAVIEARAYGHLGNAQAATDAVRRSLAADTGHRDEMHDDIGGEFGFPAERVAMSHATTYLLLRDSQGAENSADQALRLLRDMPEEQRPVLTACQAAADLARARLLRRELDGAVDALEPVFHLPTEWRGVGVVERVSGVRGELTHVDFHASPQAAQLGERIEDFCRLAVRHQLGPAARLVIEG